MKKIFKFISLLALVLVLMAAIYYSYARVIGGLYVRAIEAYKVEKGDYPKKISDLTSLSFGPVEYRWNEEHGIYFFAFQVWPRSASYIYNNYHKKWYGGPRHSLEMKMSAMLEAEFNKAQQINDPDRALAIGNFTYILGHLSGPFRDVYIGDGYQQIALAQAINRPDELESNMKKAEEHYLKTDLVDPRRLANFYTNLGFIYYTRGRYKEAIQVYTKARDLFERYPDAGYQRAKECIEGLANSYRAIGKVDEAQMRD